jgi:hypothetical protein
MRYAVAMEFRSALSFPRGFAMRLTALVSGALAAALLAGCNDSTAPRDTTPPVAPRGLRSVTGDHTAYLSWLDNTESDVAGYRVYMSECARGPGCPYAALGATDEARFTVSGLANGETRFFAVTAVDYAGNESELSGDISLEDVFDTPRPEGFDAGLNNYLDTDVASGWDFSVYSPRAWNHVETDMFFGELNGEFKMFVPDFGTDIQDAGFATTLDAVDWAPEIGWSPSGSVELIPGHCYVVWTRDNHFAKFRVTSLTAALVTFDWAYQVDPGNPELKARPAREEGSTRRPIQWARAQ